MCKCPTQVKITIKNSPKEEVKTPQIWHMIDLDGSSQPTGKKKRHSRQKKKSGMNIISHFSPARCNICKTMQMSELGFRANISKFYKLHFSRSFPILYYQTQSVCHMPLVTWSIFIFYPPVKYVYLCNYPTSVLIQCHFEPYSPT